MSEKVFHGWDGRHVLKPGALLALADDMIVEVSALREIVDAARAVSSCWDPANRVVMLISNVKDGRVDRGDAFDRLQIALQKVRS